MNHKDTVTLSDLNRYILLITLKKIILHVIHILSLIGNDDFGEKIQQKNSGTNFLITPHRTPGHSS